jgi:hypothetical protein
MLYGDVAARIKFELKADRIASDDEIKDAVYMSMRDVAKRCVPLLLVCQGNVDPLFRWIDDVNFIRQMAKPSGLTTEEIDIDDLLGEAVVFGACKVLSRDNKAGYHQMMMMAINDYEWAIYEGESNVSEVQ